MLRSLPGRRATTALLVTVFELGTAAAASPPRASHIEVPAAPSSTTDMPTSTACMSSNAAIRFVDAGHFALESNGDEVAGHVLRFLERVLPRR